MAGGTVAHIVDRHREHVSTNTSRLLVA
jgi:hypothetical protein